MVSEGQEDQTDSDRLNLIDRCLTDIEGRQKALCLSYQSKSHISHFETGSERGLKGFVQKETEGFGKEIIRQHEHGEEGCRHVSL